MFGKKRATVYPYTNEFAPLLRYWPSDSPYEIIHLVSPKGLALHGKDAAWADLGEPTGILVESDFLAALEDTDVLILADYGAYEAPKGIQGYYLDNKLDISVKKAMLAVDQGKEIVCLADLGDGRQRTLLNYAKQKNAKVTLVSPSLGESEAFAEGINRLSKITCPVVFVLGESENTSKFSVQLGLRANLEKQGYKVAVVGSRGYCQLAGVHSLPSFMLDKSMDDAEKIQAYRRYVLSIERHEKPDIMIIGVPGGIIPFTERLHNGYGIVPFLISNAVHPDMTVFCMNHWDHMVEDLYKSFENSLRYRLGCSLDCICISRNELDWSKASRHDTEFFLRYEGKLDGILQETRAINPHTYDFSKQLDLEKMTQFIIETLSGDQQAYVMEEMGEMNSVY